MSDKGYAEHVSTVGSPYVPRLPNPLACFMFPIRCMPQEMWMYDNLSLSAKSVASLPPSAAETETSYVRGLPWCPTNACRE